jgi:hypothetical protein
VRSGAVFFFFGFLLGLVFFGCGEEWHGRSGGEWEDDDDGLLMCVSTVDSTKNFPSTAVRHVF